METLFFINIIFDVNFFLCRIVFIKFHNTFLKVCFSQLLLRKLHSSWWIMLELGFKLPYVSVQFNHSFVSDSLQPHELQHNGPPCPSPTPGVYANSCPLSRWCHLTILSSVVPFSTCLQSFPASWYFQMSQLYTSGGQNRVSASTSVLPMNTQDRFPLGWAGWISL